MIHRKQGSQKIKILKLNKTYTKKSCVKVEKISSELSSSEKDFKIKNKWKKKLKSFINSAKFLSHDYENETSSMTEKNFKKPTD